jgi:hypothetical protein
LSFFVTLSELVKDICAMRGGPIAIPATGPTSVGNGSVPKSKVDHQVDRTLDLHAAVSHVSVISQAIKAAIETIQTSGNYHSPSRQRVCDLLRASEYALPVVQNSIQFGAKILAPIPSMKYASKRLASDDRQINATMPQPKRQKLIDDNTKALQGITFRIESQRIDDTGSLLWGRTGCLTAFSSRGGALSEKPARQ